MKKNLQKGFTLIELMIVVAIIAILAAIAIPAYQNYIAKSQFSESQTVSDGIKLATAEWYAQHGQCPKLGQDAGFPLAAASYAGKYVKEADIVAGTYATNPTCDIKVTFKAAGSVSKGLTDAVALFQGYTVGGNFNWKCSATTIDDKYLPSVCQSK